MKKFLLVTMMGMALTMNLYGIVKQFMVEDIEEIDHVEETTIAVYVE